MKKILFFLMVFAIANHNVFSQNNFSLAAVQPSFTLPPLNVPGEIFRFNSTATNTSNFFTQYFSGALPSGTAGFGATDRWISSGQIAPFSGQVLTGYRVQRNGRALVLGLDGLDATATPDAFIQWIGNDGITLSPGDLDFRVATNPTNANPNLVMKLKENGNVIIADGFTAAFKAIPQVRLGVYDGKATPSSNNPTFISTGAIYGVTRGLTSSGTTGQYVAGVVGDVTNAAFGISRFGLLGIAGSDANGVSTNLFGVYSIGRLAASGAYIVTSDEKLKTNINNEKSMVEKIMQLQPMTYEYNREKKSIKTYV